MILVQEPEIFFFIFWDISRLLSQHDHEAQLVRSGWGQWEDSSTSLSQQPWELSSWSFMAAGNENPFVIYVNLAGCVLTRDLDRSYSWLISLCSMDTHKNPEFCFLGKYCNSGLKSPSESLEPEVTLSQANNVQQLLTCLLAAIFLAGTYPYSSLFTTSTHFQMVLFLFS